MTDDLAVELWPEDGVRLVATSLSIRVALSDLETLRAALQGAIEALGRAADNELDAMGPVIDQ